MRIKPVEKEGPMSRVFHVEMDDAYDLAMTFVRMQEWYESPKFHHRNFSLEEFMRWYSKKYGKGQFTYPKDWSGFNIPSTAFEAVIEMADLSKVEMDLFFALEHMGVLSESDTLGGPKPFYLIGTKKGADPEDLKHEIAHGRFFVSDRYRRAVLRALRRCDTRPLEAVLLKKGYGRWTLKDEVHAYTLTGWPTGFKPTPCMRELRKVLKGIEDEHKTTPLRGA